MRSILPLLLLTAMADGAVAVPDEPAVDSPPDLELLDPEAPQVEAVQLEALDHVMDVGVSHVQLESQARPDSVRDSKSHESTQPRVASRACHRSRGYRARPPRRV